MPSGNILIKLKEEVSLEDLKITLNNKLIFLKFQKIPYEIKNENELAFKLSLVADRVFGLANNTGETSSGIDFI